jgi:uncharacterized RmlC-like cupin family protein
MMLGSRAAGAGAVDTRIIAEQPATETVMAETVEWRTHGVKVVRGKAIRRAMLGASAHGRATVFDFSGGGDGRTWIGAVSLTPGAKTGAHHHGRHEVAVYVVGGRGQIRWGARLEFVTDIDSGDYIYFAPYVPHQESNTADRALDFVVVRSDGERIAIDLDIEAVEHPQRVEY